MEEKPQPTEKEWEKINPIENKRKKPTEKSRENKTTEKKKERKQWWKNRKTWWKIV